MASVLIVYGSTTGNTESVTREVEKMIAAAGHSVTVSNASDVDPDGLCDGYDAILFGCSTWGDADLELQDDFVPLFDAFDSIRASGKKTAAFGCGDTAYTHYCGAVDAIEGKLNQMGARIVAPGLKIDGDPSDAQDDVATWTTTVIKAL